MSPLLCTLLYSGDIRGEQSGMQSTINPNRALFQAAAMFRLVTFTEKQGKCKNIYRPHEETNHISSCPKKPWSNPICNYKDKLIEVPGVAGKWSTASETNFTSLDVCTSQPQPGRQEIRDLHAPLSRCFITDIFNRGTRAEEEWGRSPTQHRGTAAMLVLQPPLPTAKHWPSRSTKQTAGFKWVPLLQLPALTGVLYWTPKRGRKRMKWTTWNVWR